MFVEVGLVTGWTRQRRGIFLKPRYFQNRNWWIGAFGSEYQLQPLARVGSSVAGALPEIYEHVEGHQNESAIIIDLALTTLRFDTELVRNMSTELSTRGCQ